MSHIITRTLRTSWGPVLKAAARIPVDWRGDRCVCGAPISHRATRCTRCAGIVRRRPKGTCQTCGTPLKTKGATWCKKCLPAAMRARRQAALDQARQARNRKRGGSDG